MFIKGNSNGKQNSHNIIRYKRGRKDRKCETRKEWGENLCGSIMSNVCKSCDLSYVNIRENTGDTGSEGQRHQNQIKDAIV